MSSLLEQAKARTRLPGPECGVVSAIANHPELAGEMNELLAAVPLKVTFAAASEVLRAAGVPISALTISRHHNGKCRCAR